MKHTGETIVYVNFTPYENAGYILDYLRRTFDTVLLFAFNFNRVSNNQSPSSLTIFQKGKTVKHITLYQLPITIKYAFILLPVRSVIIFLEILYFLMKLKRSIGVYHVFFTVNAFTAWTGQVMKKIGLVRKTVFWVWDYYPPTHKDLSISIMRRLYWIFDSVAIGSDRVVFMTKRLRALHARIRHFNPDTFAVVGIGTKAQVRRKRINTDGLRLAFLGMIKRSQGLDMVFDAQRELQKSIKNISLHVFGGGPDLEYYKSRARSSTMPVTFYGYIPDMTKLQRVLGTCDIGIALYKPESGNVSYYGDPSKIKTYLGANLPVITTDVFEFHDQIKKTGAGIIIDYGDTGALVRAIRKIRDNYPTFAGNAKSLAQKNDFSQLYPRLLG